MNWLATGSCEAITNFSWGIGAVGGLLVDIFLLLAIAQTPHLREHGGEPEPVGFIERRILPMPPFLVALLWFCGLYHVGGELLSCYAHYNAIAAAIVVGLLMLVLIPTAAKQIAIRSVW
jgi:hypothetical protein